MLDLRRMRVLREVAEQGSIAAAARALSFTSSAVSQQVAALEREAGVALVERGARSVRLTAAGRALVERTDTILAALSEAEAEIRAIEGLHAGFLRMSSFPSAYATVVPQAILEFRRRYPEVQLILTEADPLAAIADVKNGRLDLGLAFEYDFVPIPAESGVELVPLLEEPIHIVLPRGHKAARRSTVPLAALADEPWITSTTRSSCHEFVARACRAAGFEPRIALESDQHEVWFGLVAAGIGVALAPELALATATSEVEVRPVALQSLARRLYAVHRVGAGRFAAIREMLELLELACESWRAGRPRLAAAGQR